MCFCIGWVTGTSIWPNWVLVAPFDCLLHFLCFWSIVIHYQDLSAIFSFFVSSKLSEQSEPVPFLPGSFHYMFSCISSVSWHPVKFNTLPLPFSSIFLPPIVEYIHVPSLHMVNPIPSALPIPAFCQCHHLQITRPSIAVLLLLSFLFSAEHTSTS